MIKKCLVTTTVWNTEISEIQNKTPHPSGLVTATVLKKKISEFESKNPNHNKYLTIPEFN